MPPLPAICLIGIDIGHTAPCAGQLNISDSDSETNSTWPLDSGKRRFWRGSRSQGARSSLRHVSLRVHPTHFVYSFRSSIYTARRQCGRVIVCFHKRAVTFLRASRRLEKRRDTHVVPPKFRRRGNIRTVTGGESWHQIRKLPMHGENAALPKSAVPHSQFLRFPISGRRLSGRIISRSDRTISAIRRHPPCIRIECRTNLIINRPPADRAVCIAPAQPLRCRSAAFTERVHCLEHMN
jgi:hypothetical protein